MNHTLPNAGVLTEALEAAKRRMQGLEADLHASIIAGEQALRERDALLTGLSLIRCALGYGKSDSRLVVWLRDVVSRLIDGKPIIDEPGKDAS